MFHPLKPLAFNVAEEKQWKINTIQLCLSSKELPPILTYSGGYITSIFSVLFSLSYKYFFAALLLFHSFYFFLAGGLQWKCSSLNNGWITIFLFCFLAIFLDFNSFLSFLCSHICQGERRLTPQKERTITQTAAIYFSWYLLSASNISRTSNHHPHHISHPTKIVKISSIVCFFVRPKLFWYLVLI